MPSHASWSEQYPALQTSPPACWSPSGAKVAPLACSWRSEQGMSNEAGLAEVVAEQLWYWSQGEPLLHLLDGDVASAQDRTNPLSLEPLAVGQHRRKASGASGFEHDAELLVCLAHGCHQHAILHEEYVIHEPQKVGDRLGERSLHRDPVRDRFCSLQLLNLPRPPGAFHRGRTAGADADHPGRGIVRLHPPSHSGQQGAIAQRDQDGIERLPRAE